MCIYFQSSRDIGDVEAVDSGIRSVYLQFHGKKLIDPAQLTFVAPGYLSLTLYLQIKKLIPPGTR